MEFDGQAYLVARKERGSLANRMKVTGFNVSQFTLFLGPDRYVMDRLIDMSTSTAITASQVSKYLLEFLKVKAE